MGEMIIDINNELHISRVYPMGIYLSEDLFTELKIREGDVIKLILRDMSTTKTVFCFEKAVNLTKEVVKLESNGIKEQLKELELRTEVRTGILERRKEELSQHLEKIKQKKLILVGNELFYFINREVRSDSQRRMVIRSRFGNLEFKLNSVDSLNESEEVIITTNEGINQSNIEETLKSINIIEKGQISPLFRVLHTKPQGILKLTEKTKIKILNPWYAQIYRGNAIRLEEKEFAFLFEIFKKTYKVDALTARGYFRTAGRRIIPKKEFGITLSIKDSREYEKKIIISGFWQIKLINFAKDEAKDQLKRILSLFEDELNEKIEIIKFGESILTNEQISSESALGNIIKHTQTKEIEEYELEIIIPDTNILLDRLLTPLIKSNDFLIKKVIIPNIVRYEIKKKADNRERGWQRGVRELQDLRGLERHGLIELVFTGEVPKEEVDNILRDEYLIDVLKIEKNSVLLTHDLNLRETAIAAGYKAPDLSRLIPVPEKKIIDVISSSKDGLDFEELALKLGNVDYSDLESYLFTLQERGQISKLPGEGGVEKFVLSDNVWLFPSIDILKEGVLSKLLIKNKLETIFLSKLKIGSNSIKFKIVLTDTVIDWFNLENRIRELKEIHALEDLAKKNVIQLERTETGYMLLDLSNLRSLTEKELKFIIRNTAMQEISGNGFSHKKAFIVTGESDQIEIANLQGLNVFNPNDEEFKLIE